MLARLRSWVAGALRRDRVEDEMDAEMRFHVAQHVDDLVARGVARADAERQARAAFGRVESVKDACRQARALDAIDAVRRDIRYAWRLLRRSPGFALTVVATLALCIGANTAIFSVVDAVLFRPLPYPQPERLAQVLTYYSDSRHEGEFWGTSQSGGAWEMLRDGVTTAGWAAFTGSTRLNLVAGRNVQYVSQQRVTSGYFSVIGIPPVVGREFTREEDRPGAPRVVVLSHALWQHLFNGAWPLTTPLLLRGEPHTIVGVMPQDFIATIPADLWTPLRPSRTGEGAGENYTIIGRLKPGITLPAATASLTGNVRHKDSFGTYEPIDSLPVVYLPASQLPDGLAMVHVWFSPSWVVRTSSPQPGLVKSLERMIASIDPQIPFASFRRIDDLKSTALAPERFEAILLGSFSALALLLVALGLYGLIAKSVAARTHELGIRMALGSTAIRAMRTVALPIVALAGLGIACGAGMAGLSTRLLRNQIWGVTTDDPLSLGGAAVGLLLLAVAVSIAATWRIARLTPADTLRHE